MSILTGLAQEAHDDFAEDFENGTLIVPAGDRSPDGQGGFLPAQPPQDYPCKALAMFYSDRRRADLGIPASDRIILVLAGSLPAGVRPEKGHRITAMDPALGLAPRTFEVVAITGDPAAATYELQGH